MTPHDESPIALPISEAEIIAEIADRLTPEQRTALLMEKPDDALVFSPAACRSLAIYGLLETTITIFGELVRAHLAGEQQGE